MNDILKYLNNFFYKAIEKGNFKITNNSIIVKGKYVQGQYIRVEGSATSDYVYKIISVNGNVITVTGANSEEFEGTISSLAVPKSLIDLIPQIEKFKLDNKPSAIQSESFGNYSYSKSTNKSGNTSSWKEAFANELNPYRKMNDSKRGVKVVR